jgi:hypothetical protein
MQLCAMRFMWAYVPDKILNAFTKKEIPGNVSKEKQQEVSGF